MMTGRPGELLPGWRGRLHGTYHGLDDTRSDEGGVRLPLSAPRAVLVIGDAPHHGEALATVAEDAVDHRVHFGVEREDAEAAGELLAQLVVPGDPSTGGNRC
jgi:hypothetical protein